ncbi:glycoside hydrolase family 16 protein [Xylariomycetidae sp. FL0641]|nr:glycoside hydrolase family 16 protein [Xylariomycetidae sp. FL0641]
MWTNLLNTTFAIASVAPVYSGYNLVWQDAFEGGAGSPPSASNWNIITGGGANAEIEQYTTSSNNVQVSGGGTLQLIPQKNGDAWTSGRIESKYTFTPTAGARTKVEASIRFGDNPISQKQGIWPAFWLLGDSLRWGGSWPACGEIDIMETVNGILTGYGTIHCDQYPGGVCHEPDGLQGKTSVPDQSWHTWSVVFDRTPGSWLQETMTWYLDGNQFSQISGADVNNQAVWGTLTNAPLYFILNVAVGGNWPGYPNDATASGWGSAMEVAYVAHYLSA